jgi:3-hydroxyacyl-[acyl-carrier-protein] dehydratase
MSETTEPEAAANVVIGIDEIMRRLPHRAPMLLVDRCEDYVPFKSITGVKCVSYNEPFFVGHFADYPVMPGVLICEAMAQAGGVLMSKSMDASTEGRTILFMSLDAARFRKPVRPGDVLRMNVEVTRHRGDLAKFRGEAFVDGKLCAEAEFAVMIVDTPTA